MPAVTMTITLTIMLMMNRVVATHTSHAGVVQGGEPILVLPVHLGAGFVEVPGTEGRKVSTRVPGASNHVN